MVGSFGAVVVGDPLDRDDPILQYASLWIRNQEQTSTYARGVCL
jgi:hypothetical protein